MQAVCAAVSFKTAVCQDTIADQQYVALYRTRGVNVLVTHFPLSACMPDRFWSLALKYH
jgi:hypothetical protein